MGKKILYMPPLKMACYPLPMRHRRLLTSSGGPIAGSSGPTLVDFRVDSIEIHLELQQLGSLGCFVGSLELLDSFSGGRDF